MDEYEVDCDLIIHTKVKIRVTARSKDEAIDAATDMLPTIVTPNKKWKAKVELSGAPDGVILSSARVSGIDHASGSEKVKKIPRA